MGKSFRVLKAGGGNGLGPERYSRHSLRGEGGVGLARSDGEPRRRPKAAEVAAIDIDQYTKVPAQYVLEVELGTTAGDTEGGTVQLRPEMFLLSRITWASTGIGLARDAVVCTTTGGQAPLVETCPAGLLPIELFGRSIKVRWGDEFTSFMGRQTALMSALFGDSNGFLDLTDGALFAGKQTLEVDFERVFTLPGVTDGQTELVQMIFHGTGLLPPGVNESGSL